MAQAKTIPNTTRQGILSAAVGKAGDVIIANATPVRTGRPDYRGRPEI